MRIVRKTLARTVAVAAVAVTAAGFGTATALGSSAPGGASDPGAIIVHPWDNQPRAGYMTPEPLTSAQCEAIYNVSCIDPDQVEGAYNLPYLYNRGTTGKGQTIVIVDAYGSPTIDNDLLQFDEGLGLGISAPPLRIVQLGHVPAFDPSNGDMEGWAAETSLDVEYAHAGAPGANIVLVEVANDNLASLAGGVEYAVQHRLGNVISLSWGLTEQALGKSFIHSHSSVFSQAASKHITVVVSSGDSGASGHTINGGYYKYPVTSWPATSPYVTAIGGTELNLNSLGNRAGPDWAWNDTYNSAIVGDNGPIPDATGGGKSAVFARPSYQNGVRSITGGSRGIPDISMSASCSVLVGVFETFTGGQGGWLASCGTSEAAPMFASVVALADQMAGHGLGLINPTLYALAAKHAPGIVRVASGNNTVSFGNTTVHGYTVRSGYNLVTGLGSVNGQYLVPELANG
jgi:subtilase family serine protease